MQNYKVTVLGAGLAGCEAALWLAGKGVQVELYEQKPTHFSPAHKSEGFAELDLLQQPQGRAAGFRLRPAEGGDAPDGQPAPAMPPRRPVWPPAARWLWTATRSAPR